VTFNEDHTKKACTGQEIGESLPRIHILKTPHQSLIKMYGFVLVIFILCPMVIDPPLTDWAFPPNITETATDILRINLIILVIGAAFISFYRKKETFRLDNRGMKLQGEQLVPWQSIKWYNIAVFSNRGMRGIVLKTTDRKIRIVSEDDNALTEFERDLKLYITTYNPSARDYKDLKVSRTWGYAYMAMVAIAYIAGGIILEFNLIYMLLGAFTLPVIFLMIYVENIRGKPWNLFK
jgi:hypothetical protein